MKKMTKWLLLTTVAATTSVGLAASPKMTCTLTGKEMKMCCCEQQKNGKLFCKLAKKEVDKSCSRPDRLMLEDKTPGGEHHLDPPGAELLAWF